MCVCVCVCVRACVRARVCVCFTCYALYIEVIPFLQDLSTRDDVSRHDVYFSAVCNSRGRRRMSR